MLKIIKRNNSFPSLLSQSTQTVDEPRWPSLNQNLDSLPLPFWSSACFALHIHTPVLPWAQIFCGLCLSRVDSRGTGVLAGASPRQGLTSQQSCWEGEEKRSNSPMRWPGVYAPHPWRDPDSQSHTHKSGHPGTQLEGWGRNMMLHSPFCEKLGRYHMVNVWGPWMRLQVEPIDFETISKLHGHACVGIGGYASFTVNLYFLVATLHKVKI